ncbi:MAG TPA: helix-turn-helix transcriptional regulator [Candidatus Sulfomarinibacteraceae bacterium]|nr:helix-turn-helix transcriptional regulator [Candidatus Sulfomarinibacteraceae bacterium]
MTALRKKLSEAQREIGALRNSVRVLEAEEARRLNEAPKPAADAVVRFSPKWVAADRKRLGLSADDYGRLVGVSGQTIYAWERGTSRPRDERLAAWAAVRGIGKRAARQRLELLDRTDQATAAEAG